MENSKKKKKIAIVTITVGQNYGNRLQNYALQEALRSLGYDVDTIWNDTEAWENPGYLSSLKKWTRKLFHLNYTPSVDRALKFIRFNRKYISWSNYKVSKNNIPPGLGDAYDMFVCGSDQVWNPNYSRTSEIDFLTFAPEEKRIAYAASLGVNEINDKQAEMFQSYLRHFEKISVRESAGANILGKILQRDIAVVPDPVTLLTPEKWDKFMKKPKKVPDQEEYILSYFLGENTRAMEDEGYLKTACSCKVIRLEDCYSDGWDNPYFITMDPREFLWLIGHAKAVLTDSFHGCMFSIIFKRRFLAYPRQSKHDMGSRIIQLLETYHLISHYITVDKTDYKLLDLSYDTENILKNERKKGIDYLKSKIG